MKSRLVFFVAALALTSSIAHAGGKGMNPEAARTSSSAHCDGARVTKASSTILDASKPKRIEPTLAAAKPAYDAPANAGKATR